MRSQSPEPPVPELVLEDELELELLDEEELELLLEDELELLDEELDEPPTTPYGGTGCSFSQVLREMQLWPFSKPQPLCMFWHSGYNVPHQLHCSPPPVPDELLELDELLLDEELELLDDELLLDEELELLDDELLLDEELELLLDDELLELLELDELLEDDEELLELDELLELELLDESSLPLQAGRSKLPSWLP